MELTKLEKKVILDKLKKRESIKEKIRQRKQSRQNKIRMIKLSRIKSKTKQGANNNTQSLMTKKKTIKFSNDYSKFVELNI